VAPVPTQFVAAETRAAGGGVSVLPNVAVTGFIVGYTLPGGAAEFLGDCFSPPCGVKDVTNPQGSGTRLTGYSTTTSPATLNAAGATPANLQTLDVGGYILGVYQLVGPLSGVSSGGIAYNNPGGYLVAFTNDPSTQGSFALPTTGSFSFGGGSNSGGLMVDSAGNVATITLTGSFNAVSRGASFSASGTFANVSPTFGSANLSFGGSGTVPAGNNSVQGATISYTCTGTGCQSPSGSGLADIRFLHGAAGIKAMVANGGFSNATKPGNTVIFIGTGKCVSGPC
jgi:hypothetical protein